jgi:hypothetical protein
MLKKITRLLITLLLVILLYSTAWCDYDSFVRITFLKSGSSLVSADGQQSYRISLRFYPITGKEANATDATADIAGGSSLPAFMVLAGQVCRAMPGALDVQVDKKEYRTLNILFVALSPREWIESLVKELTARLKERRDINIKGWEITNEKEWLSGK